MNSKFKSYKFWLAVLGAVLIIVQNIAKANGVIITDEVGFNIINAICGGLVFLGVIDNPKEKHPKKDNSKQPEIKSVEKHNEIAKGFENVKINKSKNSATAKNSKTTKQ